VRAKAEVSRVSVLPSLKLLVLEFESPFHFGWIEPLPYIDASSIARAVFYVFTKTLPSTRVAELADALKRGELKFSSVLPLARAGDGSFTPLVPMPTLPKLGKEIPDWVPMSAAVSILANAMQCISSGCEPLVRSSGDGKALEVLCVCRDGERFVGTVAIPEVRYCVKEIAIHHNVLDRVSVAADVFRVSGYVHRPYSYLLVYCRDDQCGYVMRALEVLQHLGVGGRRGRGFGRFRIRGSEADGIDRKLVESFVSPSLEPRSLCMNLGRFSPRSIGSIDFGRSFFRLVRVEGFSGNVVNYVIPSASSACIDLGSTLLAKERDLGEVRTYSSGIAFLEAAPALPLNPLFLCVGGSR